MLEMLVKMACGLPHGGARASRTLAQLDTLVQPVA